jgi:hypothetical protein
MPAAGLWTPIGRLNDVIPERTATAPMYLEMSGVAHSDMLLIQATVDHGSGDTVSFVYHVPGAGAPDTGTLRFRVLSAPLAGTLRKC